MDGEEVEEGAQGDFQVNTLHLQKHLNIFMKAAEHTEKVKKAKEEKQIVCKRALLQKAKRDRLVKKMKAAGEL